MVVRRAVFKRRLWRILWSFGRGAWPAVAHCCVLVVICSRPICSNCTSFVVADGVSLDNMMILHDMCWDGFPSPTVISGSAS
jgi:hypothetical protein